MYDGGNEKIGTEANTLLFTADNYKFKDTNGDVNLFMNNSGNVGIGTTSPANELHVAGSMKADTSLLIGSNSNFLTSQLKVGDGTRDIRLNANHSSNAVVGTVGSHDFNLMTANTFRMTIDSSGNVGIGEDSIDANLHITGSPVVLKMERAGVRALRMGVPNLSLIHI